MIFELWGLGDLTFLTPLLRRCREEKTKVAIVSKSHGSELLAATYPEIEWIIFDAPWTAFRKKYHFWKWPWKAIVSTIFQIRNFRADGVCSVRPDPRDHLLMLLSGSPKRIGFRYARFFGVLTTSLIPVSEKQHRVESWWQIEKAIFGFSLHLLPMLSSPKKERDEKMRPLLLVHFGARIPVRRWSEAYFRVLLLRIRNEIDCAIAIVPDLDGYGDCLEDLSDEIFRKMTLAQLMDKIQSSRVLLCNDSGPSHIAAALGVPVIALFGPTSSDWFRPYGDAHHVVQRDLCSYRPCFDYCRFSEPYCLTKLTPNEVWPEIRTQLQRHFS
jgi:heptosyltransferase-2